MSHVFHRQLDGLPPVAVKGDGLYVIDAEGRRYLDACGGAAVSCLGHSHPKVVAAIKRQIVEIPFAYTTFFTTRAAETLADELVALAPSGLTSVYYVSGGSEACEAALKLARQYFLEIDQPERHRFIARLQSYHGNTLGALGAGGNLRRRSKYLPLISSAELISPCYAYRGRHAEESEEAYGRRVADELEAAILRLGPQTVAAFIAEPVVGATLGAVPAVPGYFRRIREICDRYGVLLILDEVMCGMGRTGRLHACEEDGVVPDLLFVAKGLGGGYQAIGAMLISERIAAAVRDGSGGFVHGHTYMAHAVACAAALAVQRVIREDNLLDNVRRMGGRLRAALDARLGGHPYVGDIRGRGLLLGLEFVRDRGSKEPFSPELRLHQRVKEAAMARGLMVLPIGGTIDGTNGDHVILAPPYTIEDRHVDEIVDKLARAIDAATADIA